MKVDYPLEKWIGAERPTVPDQPTGATQRVANVIAGGFIGGTTTTALGIIAAMAFERTSRSPQSMLSNIGIAAAGVAGVVAGGAVAAHLASSKPGPEAAEWDHAQHRWEIATSTDRVDQIRSNGAFQGAVFGGVVGMGLGALAGELVLKNIPVGMVVGAIGAGIAGASQFSSSSAERGRQSMRDAQAQFPNLRDQMPAVPSD